MPVGEYLKYKMELVLKCSKFRTFSVWGVVFLFALFVKKMKEGVCYKNVLKGRYADRSFKGLFKDCISLFTNPLSERQHK